MSTPYRKLYENLLPKFKSYEIPLMYIDEVEEFLHDYIIPATVRFHTCKIDLSDRDDKEKQFNVTLNDTELEILSNFLLLEYIDSNYVRVPSLLKVSLPSTDVRAFSPANFIDKLMLMHTTYLKENETLLSRYSWGGLSNDVKSKLSKKRNSDN